MRRHYGHYLRILHGCTDQFLSAAVTQMDLTPVQSRVVGYLAHRSEPPCAKDVEEEFQLSHPTVSGILSRLEKKAFVEFRPDPADRRCKRIYVLEKGWEHIGQIRRIINENEDRIVDGFTEEEKQQFAAFLERAIRNMGGDPTPRRFKEDKQE